MDIILMLYGLFALFSGKFHLIPGRVVRGPHARLAGLALASPPLLTFIYSFYYGINFALQNDFLSQQEMQTALMNDLQQKILPYSLLGLLIGIGIAVILALTAPKAYVSGYGSNKAQATAATAYPAPNTLTVEAAAAQLHVTPAQVLHLIEERKLIATWVNGTYQINAASFDKYMLFDRHTQAWSNPPMGSATPARDFADVPDISTPSAAAPNEQLKAYEDAVLRNPNDVQALFNRARAYYSAGLTGMAALDFQRVLEMQPDHPNAASMRGFILQYGNRKPSTAENAPFGEDMRS